MISISRASLWIFSPLVVFIPCTAQLHAKGQAPFSMKTYVYKTVAGVDIHADVYRHADQRKRPVLVWIHGGALINGSRSQVPQRLARLCQLEGFILISLDYRLAPEVKLPAIIEDIKDAFRWIQQKGPKLFHADTDRIVVAGGSAGGYLTLMTGICVEPKPTALVAYWGYGDVDGDWYTKPSQHYRKLPLVPKKEALAAVGGKVLTGTDRKSRKNRGRYYLYLRQNGLWTKEVTGFDLVKEKKKLDPYCPVRNVTKSYPITMMIHGTKDNDVPYEQSAAMAKELKRVGVEHQLITLKGAGHGLAGGNRQEIQKAHQQALTFIKQHLQKKKSKRNTIRPNIIVVMTDDQGYGDLGIHGNKRIRTPKLDAFAKESVALTQFYCSPVCAPTRAALMTGRYYYRTGVIHTSRGGAKMHGEETTIAELLRGAGYQTAIFGKWHLGDNYPMRPIDQGFQEALVHKSGGIGQTPDKPNSYFNPILWHNGKQVQAKGYCTDVFFDEAIQYIEKNRSKPFFVYIATNAPHTPLQIAEKYVAPYRKRGLDEATAKVYGMITNIDDNFGKLMAKLKEQYLEKTTVVIFITDNGPQQKRYNAGLKGRKSSVYEGGIRVPAYIRWSGTFQAGLKVKRIAAHIDLLPTIAKICQVQLPTDLQVDGRSLLPLLQKREVDWPERALFFQCHRGLTPKRYQNAAVRANRYKLVLNPGTFGQADAKLPAKPKIELYDLHEDPGEKQNIATEKPAVVQPLLTQYNRWFDNVKKSRQFEPGIIHIGSEKEPVATLCRYQDGNFRKGVSQGWSVFIEKAGNYRIQVKQKPFPSASILCCKINNKLSKKDVPAGSTTAIVPLPNGKYKIDIWLQEKGAKRIIYKNNDTFGDVVIKRLQNPL